MARLCQRFGYSASIMTHRSFLAPARIIGVLLIGALLAPQSATAQSKPSVISLEADGFTITTPGGGHVTLAYPSLLDEAQNATKPTAATVNGNTASRRVPARRQAHRPSAAARPSRSTSAACFDPPAHSHGDDPARRVQGRRDVAAKGQDAKPFPTQFDGEQFLFKGEPKPLTLTAAKGGAAFTIAMPFGWQQMQDGRKWNSPNFDYLFTTSMPRGEGNEAWFTFKLWPGGADQEPDRRWRSPRPAKPPTPDARTESHPATDAGRPGDRSRHHGTFTLDYPVLRRREVGRRSQADRAENFRRRRDDPIRRRRPRRRRLAAGRRHAHADARQPAGGREERYG